MVMFRSLVGARVAGRKPMPGMRPLQLKARMRMKKAAKMGM